MMKNLAQVDKMMMNVKIRTICQIHYHPREPIDLVCYHSNFQRILLQVCNTLFKIHFRTWGSIFCHRIHIWSIGLFDFAFV